MNKLLTLQNTGAISSVASLMASLGFLADQYSKITKNKLNESLFKGRQVTPEDLEPFWWISIVILALESAATLALYIVTRA